MKRLVFLVIGLNVISTAALAECNLTCFRWDCDLTLHIRPTSYAHSTVRCGNSYGYVTTAEYDRLARYQRAYANMSLSAKDEYIDGPCVPEKR